MPCKCLLKIWIFLLTSLQWYDKLKSLLVNAMVTLWKHTVFRNVTRRAKKSMDEFGNKNINLSVFEQLCDKFPLAN